jgi:hypothetical protein
MAKRKAVVAGDMAAEPARETREWARSPGGYIAGRAYVDEADLTAAEMEKKWGAGRLRLLVGPELREKADRQRYKFNQAIWHGGLEDVQRESMRMVKAWLALDRAADAAGKERLWPLVWEVAVPDGDTPDCFVAAIVPTEDDARAVRAEGRKVKVYTLDEIGRLLAALPGVAKIKESFPGASVVRGERSAPADPLLSIHDTDGLIDDPIEDLL